MIKGESIGHDYIRNLVSVLLEKCQVSPERIALDLESEVMRGLGSIPSWGKILSPDFISRSKDSDANIGILANFVEFVKNHIQLKTTN